MLQFVMLLSLACSSLANQSDTAKATRSSYNFDNVISYYDNDGAVRPDYNPDVDLQTVSFRCYSL